MRFRPTLFLGRWAGVEIRLDLLVVGLIALLFFSSLSDAQSRGAPRGEVWSAVAHLALLVAMLLCMFGHEVGHAVMCKLRGHQPTMILLSFVGLTFFKTGKVKPRDEFLIALSGPAVNLSIALLTSPFIFMALADGRQPLFSQSSMATLYGFLAWLSVLNFAVAFLNLIPGWPADGARAVRAFLSNKYGYAAATVRAVSISHGFWLILAGLSVIVMVLAPAIGALAAEPRTRSPAAMIVMYNILFQVFAVLGLFYGWSEMKRVARLGADEAAKVVGPPPEFMPKTKPRKPKNDEPEGDTEGDTKDDKAKEEVKEAIKDADKAADDAEVEKLSEKARNTFVAGKAMWSVAKATGKGTGWFVKKGAQAVGSMLASDEDKDSKDKPKQADDKKDNKKGAADKD